MKKIIIVSLVLSIIAIIISAGSLIYSVNVHDKAINPFGLSPTNAKILADGGSIRLGEITVTNKSNTHPKNSSGQASQNFYNTIAYTSSTCKGGGESGIPTPDYNEIKLGTNKVIYISPDKSDDFISLVFDTAYNRQKSPKLFAYANAHPSNITAK